MVFVKSCPVVRVAVAWSLPDRRKLGLLWLGILWNLTQALVRKVCLHQGRRLLDQLVPPSWRFLCLKRLNAWYRRRSELRFSVVFHG